MRSLTLKLTLAFLLVSLTGIALVAALMWGITATEFNRFLIDRGLNNYTAAVTNYYQTHHSWEGVEEALLQPQQNVAASPDNQPDPNLPDDNGLRHIPFVLMDQNGLVLIPSGPFRQGEQITLDPNQQNIAITVDNQVVGYVMTTGRPPQANPLEERFLARTNQALLLAAFGAGLLAVILGLVLARTITRPVRDLTLATSAVAKGHLNQLVPVRSNDELGELTKTFNTMSADLAQANHLRQQMTADIAHDLRTPLAVITGYLEGLKDGVVKPTPKRFTAMYDEAIFLQRLVEDLRTLSLADAGELSMNCQPTQPEELIDRLAATFQHQAEQNGVGLQTNVQPNLPPVKIDPERMQQALSNLVSNAIRYTPKGGSICLSAKQVEGQILLEVQDSGSGIAPELLPHIFERFYRGDDSRQEGGSGLGLAITKSVVELQGGSIHAASNGLGQGSRFTIQLIVST